jgi:hypothetical protein
LIGEAPEVICTVNGVNTKALVDTGSQVTSIAESLYNKQFSKIPLHDVSKCLRIETVGGQTLPYHGCFNCTISIPVSDSTSFTITVPTFVVPDTTYNAHTPLLLGTNVLYRLCGLSEQPTSRPLKLAVQALNLQARHLDKSQGVYANVLSVSDITIPPFSGKVMEGRATIAIPVCQQIALVQQCSDSISVVPSLVSIKQGSNCVPIDMVNETDSVIHIQKGEHLANLHQASIHVEPKLSDDPEIVDSFIYSHLNECEATESKQFLSQHRGIFLP